MNAARSNLIRRAAMAFSLGSVAILLPSAASASETITYTYDARGRLVQVERAQPTTNVKTKYTYDAADNRIKKEVTTTP